MSIVKSLIEDVLLFNFRIFKITGKAGEEAGLRYPDKLWTITPSQLIKMTRATGMYP